MEEYKEDEELNKIRQFIPETSSEIKFRMYDITNLIVDVMKGIVTADILQNLILIENRPYLYCSFEVFLEAVEQFDIFIIHMIKHDSFLWKLQPNQLQRLISALVSKEYDPDLLNAVVHLITEHHAPTQTYSSFPEILIPVLKQRISDFINTEAAETNYFRKYLLTLSIMIKEAKFYNMEDNGLLQICYFCLRHSIFSPVNALLYFIVKSTNFYDFKEFAELLLFLLSDELLFDEISIITFKICRKLVKRNQFDKALLEPKICDIFQSGKWNALTFKIKKEFEAFLVAYIQSNSAIIYEQTEFVEALTDIILYSHHERKIILQSILIAVSNVDLFTEHLDSIQEIYQEIEIEPEERKLSQIADAIEHITATFE